MHLLKRWRYPLTYGPLSPLQQFASTPNPHLCSLVRLQESRSGLQARHTHNNSNNLPTPPPLISLETSQDYTSARQWLLQFRRSEILKEHVEISFSRSSGPGGQNVNKVNTKTTLRVPLAAAWIPRWAHDDIKKSPYYASSSGTIVMASTTFRSQAQNIEDVLSKLHSLIATSASKHIKTEPSEDQKQRVEKLKQAEKVRRREDKCRRSETRRNRSSKWDD